MDDLVFPVFESLKEPENYPISIDQIKNDEFTRTLKSTYLDHAASTLYSEKQLESVFRTLQSSVFSNPHSRHPPSYSTTEAIESIRHMILKHFNTNNKVYDLVFTAGATEAIRIVAEYFTWNKSSSTERNLECQGMFVYTQENHSSVLGIRKSAHEKGAMIYCLDSEAVEGILQQTHEGSLEGCSFNDSTMHTVDNCLFAYPALCNFSGSKYPLTWVEEVQKGKLNLGNRSFINAQNSEVKMSKRYKKWFVLLDAASFVATSPLDLSKYRPDFLPISFYKMFGYPTGLGCLLINKRAWNCLVKPYFGGGTVKMVDSRTMDVELRDSLHEKFEDGTLPFLDILSLKHGFSCLLRISGGMTNIEKHVFNLSRYLTYNLRSLRHKNNTPVVQIYSKCCHLTVDNHGSIVNFNVKDSQEKYVGFSQVEKVASLYNIYLRTGCVCNPGACQKYLNISPEQLKAQFEAGHICGDAKDLVEGMPTGSVRVSFGYMSSYKDADAILNMIRECFVEGKAIIDMSWLKQKETKSVENNVSLENVSTIENNNKLRVNLVSDSTDSALNFSRVLNYVSESKTTKSIKTMLSDNEKSSDKIDNIQNPEFSRYGNDVFIGEKSLCLTDIIIYPVKSCAGVILPRWRIGRQSLDYDRQWMIVTSSGVTLTQKRAPELSLLKPSVIEARNVLVLSRKGHGSAEVSLNIPPENEAYCDDALLCGGRVCGDKVKGIDCGPEIAEWLSNALQMEELRLVRQIKARKCKLSIGEREESLSLANESQYLVIHKPSLRLLMRQMNERQLSKKISEEELKLRFRPNFVIDGGEPYEEDNWKAFTIGNQNFTVLGKCTRCQMVCVNPESGERSKEPMITLGSTRGPSMSFGIHSSYTGNNLHVCSQDTCTDYRKNDKWHLHVGMPVTVKK